LEEPELLILDEPTNHLDMKTAFFLEEYLASFKGALLAVSHDRYFLDRTARFVYEIENKRLSVFKGNYTAYKKLKTEKTARLQKEYEAYLEESRKLQEYIDKNRVRATTAKSAQSRVKQLERLTPAEKPYLPPSPPQFSFTYDVSPYETVVEGENFSVEAGGKMLIENASFILKRGEKCALVGENGTGKSTLVKEIVRGKNRGLRLGRFVKIGYYDQENAELSAGETVLGELWGRHVTADQTSLRKDLARAGLSAEDVYKTVSELSGGERAKLALAVLQRERGNFLILDEPTNHLDLPAREALERALCDFSGTLLIVSHDRYFIGAVAGEIAEIENNRLTLYRGGYEAYVSAKREAAKEAAKEMEEAEKEAYLAAREQKRRSSHQSREERAAEAVRRQKLSEIEKRVEALEEEEKTLTAEISSPEIAQNFAELNKRCLRIEKVHEELDAAYAEYEKYI
ncbi:MAG: ABC-F family ATP-binding cassette domain-containing protein, partial [Candidatus Scatosoma sp.]